MDTQVTPKQEPVSEQEQAIRAAFVWGWKACTRTICAMLDEDVYINYALEAAILHSVRLQAWADEGADWGPFPPVPGEPPMLVDLTDE